MPPSSGENKSLLETNVNTRSFPLNTEIASNSTRNNPDHVQAHVIFILKIFLYILQFSFCVMNNNYF